MKKAYHIPVLLSEAVAGLNIKDGGLYVDATYGGGGHSAALMETAADIKLLAFDKDQEAENNARHYINEHPEYKENFTFFRSDYRYVQNFLNYAGFQQADGLLADLGVSSRQFDDARRGFSFRTEDAVPDMRMNKKSAKTALKVLNEYPEKDLYRIFKNYGELKKARFMASLIVNSRNDKPIETSADLNSAVSKALPKYSEYKILAQLYQALRIEVNDELKGLEKLLKTCPEIIKKGGRLVILTYHSLEDRLVKNFMKSGNFSGELQKDIFGNPQKDFELLKPKIIRPSEEEIQKNSRAASAKLRIAQRL